MGVLYGGRIHFDRLKLAYVGICMYVCNLCAVQGKKRAILYCKREDAESGKWLKRLIFLNGKFRVCIRRLEWVELIKNLHEKN